MVKGYTSPGVGCSGVSARFLCPPELVLIELCQTQRLYNDADFGPSLTARSILDTGEGQEI
jgi:hypothetical protein